MPKKWLFFVLSFIYILNSNLNLVTVLLLLSQQLPLVRSKSHELLSRCIGIFFFHRFNCLLDINVVGARSLLDLDVTVLVKLDLSRSSALLGLFVVRRVSIGHLRSLISLTNLLPVLTSLGVVDLSKDLLEVLKRVVLVCVDNLDKLVDDFGCLGHCLVICLQMTILLQGHNHFFLKY